MTAARTRRDRLAAVAGETGAAGLGKVGIVAANAQGTHDTQDTQEAQDTEVARLAEVADEAWVDVVRKMDEVYAQLVRDEIALEQKNAELGQSQQFIASVLASMSDVMIVCDHTGRIEQTNDALCRLVGSHAGALRGTAVLDLLADDESRLRVAAVLGSAAPAGEGTGIELNLRGASGSVTPVDVNCTPRLGSRGKRVGHVFVGRPIGEIKRAYRELRETHEALKRTQQQLLHAEKLSSLGRLVAGVAHELNNPISFVLGNVHALARYTERLAAYVQLIHRGDAAQNVEAQRTRLRIDHIVEDLPSLIEGTREGAQRTADIVQGLKRFSAIDRDDSCGVDLNPVVERAIAWVTRGTAPSFDVRWHAPPGCVVMGNAGQLLQVLMNLIQNACDAASGVAGRPPALDIRASRGGSHVTLRFRDNGPGIAPEHLDRVFEPFFTTKPVGKGTGLGLSISYGIVERCGGRLSARNHEDGGAEFVLELLAAPPEPGIQR